MVQNVVKDVNAAIIAHVGTQNQAKVSFSDWRNAGPFLYQFEYLYFQGKIPAVRKSVLKRNVTKKTASN